jgi:hypothetical protein
MAKLPKSWGLKTKRRNDGKIDIIGKDDAGRDYRVRTTDHSEITDKDLRELKNADRESYSNRTAGVREAVKNLVGEPERKLTLLEQTEAALHFDESDWIAAAEPVVRAGFGRPVLGYGREYSRGFEQWVESLKRSN